MRLKNKNIRKIIGSILILFLVFAMISVFSSMRKNNKLVSNSSNKDSLTEDELIQQNCEHTYSSWQTKTEPTCTVKGEKIRTCSICNYVETSSISVIAHNYEEKYRVESTCTEQGQIGYLCTMCKDSYFVSIDPAHTLVVDPAVAATCTTTGLTEGSHCSVCSEIIVAQEVTSAAHTPQVNQAAKEPTCTTYGNTAGISCSVCGAIIQVSEQISPIDHNYVHFEAQSATCTSVGWEAYDECSMCGDSTYVEIAALGHSFTGEWIKVSGKSYWYKECTRCGEQSEQTANPDLELYVVIGSAYMQTTSGSNAYGQVAEFIDDTYYGSVTIYPSSSVTIELKAVKTYTGYAVLSIESYSNCECSITANGSDGYYTLTITNVVGNVEILISGSQP